MSIGPDTGIWTSMLGGALAPQQAPRGLGLPTAFYNSAEDSVLADRYRHLRSTFELGPEEFDKLVLSSMEGRAYEPAKG